MTDRYKDLVVVLPGITGSVLQRDGKDVWALSGRAVWSALTSLGGSVRDLELTGDDPEAEDLGDGVVATRIIDIPHVIPGLYKSLGYRALIDRLQSTLGLKVGRGEGAEAGNLFEFPYDWRRDNRAAARRLDELIRTHLPRWREASGAGDARVVLVAHSMGGLVSRYYLEALGGWRHCRALVTFGTPFRGSPQSLNYLVNGYKKLFLELTELLRSCTSVYQLLPRYECIDVGGRLARPAEIEGLAGFDRKRAAAAYDFHLEIDRAVESHAGSPGYLIEPIVGMGQPTLQSATLIDGVLRCTNVVPRGWNSALGDGDGTVPRVSATPLELSEQFRETFIPERHSALQLSAGTIDQVVRKLDQMAAGPPVTIRAGRLKTAPYLSVDLEDAYLVGEPVEIDVVPVNHIDSLPSLTVMVKRTTDGTAVPLSRPPSWTGAAYSVAIEGLPPGGYELTVGSKDALGGPVPAVHDIFEVTEP